MKRLLFLVSLLFVTSVQATYEQSVTLDVPLIKQGKNLCGPATIEMLFRYWGINRYNQYAIATSILQQFPNSKHYLKSGIFESKPFDFDKYPGTGTINMREFLKRYGETRNFMLENESRSIKENITVRSKLFTKVKTYVSRQVPVIVHQYWKLPKSTGHYRIVTGYDEERQEVYLNDADGGKRLIQTYDQFLKVWNFDQRWLHYNTIVFNVDRKRLDFVIE